MGVISATAALCASYGWLAQRPFKSSGPIVPQDYYTDEKGKLVWDLAGYTNCPRENYKDFNFFGRTEGFVMTKVLHGKLWDNTGFIGTMENDKNILVTWRGTGSKRNQELTSKNKLVEFKAAPECACLVHEGQQAAIDDVFPEMLAEVQRLQALHPDFTVLVNGHSLGGALATMSAIRLQLAGVDVKLITLGAYRIGDPDFVDFFNQRIPDAYRVVNDKDFVPHSPFRFLGYKHAGTEFYQEEGSIVTRQCDGSG